MQFQLGLVQFTIFLFDWFSFEHSS